MTENAGEVSALPGGWVLQEVKVTWDPNPCGEKKQAVEDGGPWSPMGGLVDLPLYRTMLAL